MQRGLPSTLGSRLLSVLSLFLSHIVGYSFRTSISPREFQGHLTTGVRNLRIGFSLCQNLKLLKT